MARPYPQFVRPRLPTQQRPWFGRRTPWLSVGANRMSWEACLCLLLVALGLIFSDSALALLALLPGALLLYAAFTDVRNGTRKINPRQRIFPRPPKSRGTPSG